MTFKILSIIINCKKMTDFWGTFPNQRERIDSAFKKIGKERNAIRKVHIKDVLISILFNPSCSLLEYALYIWGFEAVKKPSVNLRKAPSTWKAIARAALTDGEKNALINKFNPDDFITADILPKKYQLTKVNISLNSFLFQ